jgi:Xaa-Pro aminopeptidase
MNRSLSEGDQIGILVEVNDPSGYYTHLHRLVCIGKIPDELNRLFEIAKEAQKVTLNMLKPGADSQKMLQANNEFLVSRGYPEETRLYAHGQGYDLVERPSFQPGETMKIKAGMNIAVHPVVSGKGTGLLCDNYIVTETGVSDCLHKTPKEIFVV